jgi:hypothetical protein
MPKTNNREETLNLAKEYLGEMRKNKGSDATVLLLEGNLGSGKTTFTQGLAQALHINDRFVDHYGDEPATMPLIEEEIVIQQGTHLDPLSQPTEPSVISNQPPRSDPSPAMLRTFKLQEEINRRRKKQGN